MSFRVLACEGAGAEEWRGLIERLPPPLRDLHYFPEYGRIYADSYGYMPFLAVLEEPAGFVLQALVRRPLDALPFLADQAITEPCFDVATPYGFGGPLPSDPGAADMPDRMRRFDRALHAWLLEQRIATEFTCCHPLLGNHAAIEAAGTVPLHREKEVVVIDLSRDEHSLWRAVSRGTRSSIQAARRNGVVVEQVDPTPDSLAAFRALYLETMQRHDAAERWMVPERYFPACVEHMGPGASALFFARCEGELAAGYLLLHDARTAYYHFGASSGRWLHRRPNNLLMYETILWARRHGLARYHLGGGVTVAGDDSLLRFKSSFGGDRAVLYTFGRVHDDGMYRRLCDWKRAHERRVHGAELARDYFPLYRR